MAAVGFDKSGFHGGQSQPVAASRTRAVQRLDALDAGRTLATFAIVWNHLAYPWIDADGLAMVGRFGVPFFLLAAIFFAFKKFSTAPSPVAPAIHLRIQRVLWPFFAWSLIYIALDALAGVMGWWRPASVTFWTALRGGSVHLWFLPVAFAAGCAAVATAAWVRGAPRKRGVAVVAGALLLGIGMLVIPFPREIVDRMGSNGRLLERWWQIGSVFWLGMAGCCAWWFLGWPRRIRPVVAVVALMLFAALEVTIVTAHLGRSFSQLAGILLFVATLGLSDHTVLRRLAYWGRQAYPVYLMHLVPVLALKQLPGFVSLGAPERLVLTIFVAMSCYGAACGWDRLLAMRAGRSGARTGERSGPRERWRLPSKVRPTEGPNLSEAAS